MEGRPSQGAPVIIKAPEDEDPVKGAPPPSPSSISKGSGHHRNDSGYLSTYNTVTPCSCSSDYPDSLSLPGPGALDREAEPADQTGCEAGSQQLRDPGWRKPARSEHSERGLPLSQDARDAGGDTEPGVNVTDDPLRPLAWSGPCKKEKAWTEGPGAHLQELLPRQVDTQPTETPAGAGKRCPRCLLPSKELRSNPYFITVALIAALLLLVVLILGAKLSVVNSSMECPTPPRVEPCPLDWLNNGRKCFRFSKEEAEWEDSQIFCSSYNASLALIDTQEELDFMLDLICRKHMWIGLRYSGTQFHWVNGTACNSKVCAITDEGECVYMGSNALRVSGCDIKRPFICTKKPHI
ncbi:killer cell lectin-like receptor subfamily B member 1B allele B [Ambystoma mexicanum]|uniref:killer cell lectin-like receptor subfamily B member 1B allele B n=1 Tax=Ambystoma mexicanum TaxID=8296 RepID=UPI0037E866EC